MASMVGSPCFLSCTERAPDRVSEPSVPLVALGPLGPDLGDRVRLGAQGKRHPFQRQGGGNGLRETAGDRQQVIRGRDHEGRHEEVRFAARVTFRSLRSAWSATTRFVSIPPSFIKARV